MDPLENVVVLSNEPTTIGVLAAALVEGVAAGGALTFFHPMAFERAQHFWTEAFKSADRGELIVFGAFDQSQLVGTATLRVVAPETQPHRAEILKVITRVSHRRRGVAKALLQAAERHARRSGKTLLSLEAAAGSGAASLYENLGFKLAGVIPQGEMTSFGELIDTAVYIKRLGAAEANRSSLLLDA